jgi:hypothetical protein
MPSHKLEKALSPPSDTKQPFLRQLKLKLKGLTVHRLDKAPQPIHSLSRPVRAAQKQTETSCIDGEALVNGRKSPRSRTAIPVDNKEYSRRSSSVLTSSTDEGDDNTGEASSGKGTIDTLDQVLNGVYIVLNSVAGLGAWAPPIKSIADTLMDAIQRSKSLRDYSAKGKMEDLVGFVAAVTKVLEKPAIREHDDIFKNSLERNLQQLATDLRHKAGQNGFLKYLNTLEFDNVLAQHQTNITRDLTVLTANSTLCNEDAIAKMQATINEVAQLVRETPKTMESSNVLSTKTDVYGAVIINTNPDVVGELSTGNTGSNEFSARHAHISGFGRINCNNHV